MPESLLQSSNYHVRNPKYYLLFFTVDPALNKYVLVNPSRFYDKDLAAIRTSPIINVYAGAFKSTDDLKYAQDRLSRLFSHVGFKFTPKVYPPSQYRDDLPLDVVSAQVFMASFLDHTTLRNADEDPELSPDPTYAIFVKRHAHYHLVTAGDDLVPNAKQILSEFLTKMRIPFDEVLQLPTERLSAYNSWNANSALVGAGVSKEELSPHLFMNESSPYYDYVNWVSTSPKETSRKLEPGVKNYYVYDSPGPDLVLGPYTKEEFKDSNLNKNIRHLLTVLLSLRKLRFDPSNLHPYDTDPPLAYQFNLSSFHSRPISNWTAKRSSDLFGYLLHTTPHMRT